MWNGYKSLNLGNWIWIHKLMISQGCFRQECCQNEGLWAWKSCENLCSRGLATDEWILFSSSQLFTKAMQVCLFNPACKNGSRYFSLLIHGLAHMTCLDVQNLIQTWGSRTKVFFTFLIFFVNLFYVYECSICLYVCGLYIYKPCTCEG